MYLYIFFTLKIFYKVLLSLTITSKSYLKLNYEISVNNNELKKKKEKKIIKKLINFYLVLLLLKILKQIIMFVKVIVHIYF